MRRPQGEEGSQRPGKKVLPKVGEAAFCHEGSVHSNPECTNDGVRVCWVFVRRLPVGLSVNGGPCVQPPSSVAEAHEVSNPRPGFVQLSTGRVLQMEAEPANGDTRLLLPFPESALVQC